jgi:DNA-binding CsgD family transcriptional regulator
MQQSALAEPAALLEREHEVERMRAVLDAAGEGAGTALIVEAAAGMGKSRLLELAQQGASELGIRVLSARATALEQGYPFGLMRQLFERLLIEADTAERDRWLAGAAALAADVLVGTPATAPRGPPAGPSGGDPGYSWQHGLYWLACNLAADSPVALVVDDLQWCDVPSAGALAFIARRLEGQRLALILATRPLDPALAPEAATLIPDPGTELLRLLPLTEAAVGALVAARLSAEPDDRFVRACLEVTGGNPFLLGELLTEVAARGVEPTAAAAAGIDAIVPEGIANGVLLRLARLAPAASTLARALSALDDGAQVGDAARLVGIAGADLEAAMSALVYAGVVESGGTVRFTHPILRTAIYGDLSPAERERLHRRATTILRERGAPPGQVAAQVMHTDPAGDPETVTVLREAAGDALALGDAAGAAALLSRAMDEPPSAGDRGEVVLRLGLARARTGDPQAMAPLGEIVERGDEPRAIACAAVELGGMLFFAGRAPEGAAILRRAEERLPAGEPLRDELELALLSSSVSSASARREAEAAIAGLRDPGGPATSELQATTLAVMAIEAVMNLRPASTVADLAKRALAADLPLELHRSGNWAILALAALALSDEIDAALRGTDEILARARERGAALTVLTISSLRANFALRRGDLAAAEADADEAIALAPDLLGTKFLVLGVGAAVLAGLERGDSPESLRRLIKRTGVKFDSEFVPSGQLRYASAVLSAAAGNHEAAIEEFRSCGLDHPTFGGENPAAVPWRSAAALSLAELGRLDEARVLAADELLRARSFGAASAIGIALRADAMVGPREERVERLAEAAAVLASSPARLEHTRVLLDLGATLRAAGQRRAAREPLLEALSLAARCGARALERRARAELGSIGIRPRGTERAGADSLTPSERRVVELAAGGDTNRQIAQTLFVTEKTVETHLGHAFRKLDVSSRRQLPDVLAPAVG